jgi:Na+-driven multidrug efflux pump
MKVQCWSAASIWLMMQLTPASSFIIPTARSTFNQPKELSRNHSTSNVLFNGGQNSENNEEVVPVPVAIKHAPKATVIASKREMMKFAIPALGIFLAQPLMSNIDNAFVGKTAGTIGLAALSPATICTDQMLYLFSFISRATTGIVSRAYASKGTEEENIAAARDAASTPLTFSIVCGIFLSIFYAFYTPKMLLALDVDPILRPASASYVYWRGAVSWAALVQSVCLSVLLATRDAVTPLKVIGVAAGVNMIGDALFCVYPFRMGTAGAAAATAFATVYSSGRLLQDLSKKNLLPKLSLPTWSTMKELLQYVGPLFIITIARLTGFISMQRRAMTFGTGPLAAYQICANALILFFLFGEPLSQLHQTKLPAFLDVNDKESTISTIKSVMTLAAYTSLGVGFATFLTLTLGPGLFTSDLGVQAIVRNTAPAVSVAVMQAIVTTALDGAMLASRDFSFIILVGLLTCYLQLVLAARCMSLSSIFGSFTIRLAVYVIAVVLRVGSGSGILGKVLVGKKGDVSGTAAVPAAAPAE